MTVEFSNIDLVMNDSPLINKSGEDFYTISDAIKALGIKIEAARSGRVNGNLCFYTPKAMRQGTRTFVEPFPKHVQSKHNGEALGPITEAEYVPEFFPNASKEFIDLVKKIELYSEQRRGKELVKAVKELIKTPEYRDDSYRGLGISNIYADIHDPKAIREIKTRETNKGTVSIGGKSSELYCSICGDRLDPSVPHEHEKGKVYNNEVCFHIHNDLLLDHCGFVTVPADTLTNTEVVRDSKDESLNISITHVKTEKCMQLEQLKEAVKDLEAVKKLIATKVPDEAKQEAAFQAYEATLKNSRSNHHLFVEGKLLNLRSVVGVAVAEHLISQMADDDDNKAYLTEIVDKAKKVLGVEDTDKALEDLLTPQEKEEAPEEAAEAPEAKVEDSDNLVSKVTEAVTNAIATALADLKAGFAQVKDNQQESLLAKEVQGLRDALEADEKVIGSLQTKYKEALISLIIAKKGGAITDAYREKLNARTAEELKLTLEDLEETAKAQVEEVEADKTLDKATKDDAIAKIEDQQQDNQEQVADESNQEEAEQEKTVTVEDSVQQDPQAWLERRISEIGLSQAAKEFKLKFGAV